METFWENTKEKLKTILGTMSFDTWIAPLYCKEVKETSVLLEAPDKFFKDWVENNYSDQIKQALHAVSGKYYDLIFEVNPELLKRKTNKILKTLEKNFQEEPQDSLRLNPRYTFDNFIVGSSNRMAHAAALGVADAPGKAYNPLFIYGGVGLGKTHIMQSIAHAILSKNSAAKVKYTSTERFTNELISSIRNRTTERFRIKYRNIDVLLIDDVQFLSGKEAAQEEFFNTFNVLYDCHKQIILSSDRLPKEIPKLEERLVSRFNWGLIVDIQPPNFETRVAILQKKLEKEPVKIDDSVTHFIAQNISTNIRELEGALIRIIAYSLVENKPITLELAQETLKNMVKEIKKQITPDIILNHVSNYFNISKEEIKQSKRNKGVLLPRQVAMYLIRQLTDLSFPEIGSYLGAKHHTTILYAHKKLEDNLKKDDKLQLIVNSLLQEIKS